MLAPSRRFSNEVGLGNLGESAALNTWAGGLMTTRQLIGRDLGVALIGFGIMFSLVYMVGQLLLPSSGSSLDRLVAQGEESKSSLIDDLSVELAAVTDPAALISYTGAVEGRHVLDVVTVPYVWVPVGPELDAYAPDGPVDIHVSYSRGGMTLSVVADQAVAGSPRAAGMTIVFTVDGRSFTAKSGDCALELSRSGYTLDLTPTGAAGLVLATPYFAGHVSCEDVADIRSGDTISFSVVFRYEPPRS